VIGCPCIICIVFIFTEHTLLELRLHGLMTTLIGQLLTLDVASSFHRTTPSALIISVRCDILFICSLYVINVW
jgi:hypothetical protein